MPKFLTTREVAERISTEHDVDVAEWQIRRLFEDGTLPELPRFAGKRMITERTIPTIVKALERRGWMAAQVA